MGLTVLEGPEHPTKEDVDSCRRQDHHGEILLYGGQRLPDDMVHNVVHDATNIQSSTSSSLTERNEFPVHFSPAGVVMPTRGSKGLRQHVTSLAGQAAAGWSSPARDQ